MVTLSSPSLLRTLLLETAIIYGTFSLFTLRLESVSTFAKSLRFLEPSSWKFTVTPMEGLQHNLTEACYYLDCYTAFRSGRVCARKARTVRCGAAEDGLHLLNGNRYFHPGTTRDMNTDSFRSE
jgi:hypothetical protein